MHGWPWVGLTDARETLPEGNEQLQMAAKLTTIRAKTGDNSAGAGLGLGCAALFDSTAVSWAPKGSVSIHDARF